MYLIWLLLVPLWLFTAVFDYSVIAYVLQLKWYRFDRLADFFRSTQGKIFWKNYHYALRTVSAIIGFFLVGEYVQLYIFFLLIYVCIASVKKILTNQFRRPEMTIKVMMLIVLSILTEVGIWYIYQRWQIFLIIFLFRFVIMSFYSAILFIPTRAYIRLCVWRATKKCRRFPNCRVIGITGSYGKTTTKDFLVHLLKDQFRVVATPRNINSDLGIAKFILSTPLENTDICIVEMGATKRGDIALCCQMVCPSIGIVTAINEEHLALFGTIQNIQNTKYELLRAIPTTGLAVTNTDNRYCREHIPTLAAPIETFGTIEKYHPSLQLTKVQTSLSGSTGTMQVGGATLPLSVPFPGAHWLMNIAPCVLVARYLGISDRAIIDRVNTLPTPSRLCIYHYGSVTIIDDSYNSNPDGFRAALDLLDTFPETMKKIVITRGIIELGEKSDEIHEAIGERISLSADILVVISPDAVHALERGVQRHKKTSVQNIFDPQQLLLFVQSLKNNVCVILFENRLPSIIQTEMTPYKNAKTV